jgi:hypothetical protein
MMGDFDLATRPPDLETIRLLLLLAKELYEATGTWPSATALQTAMKRPGL